MNDDATIIEQTKKWIHSVVIGCNLCPFASRVMNKHAVTFKVEHSDSIYNCLESFMLELIRFDQNETNETGFVIFTNAVSRFEDYLDLLDAAERLIKKENYTGKYQVASFHPQYRFAGSDESDAANYTNRSVYPMLHILRERSIDEALAHYTSPENIPQRNIEFCREKGLEYMKLLRDACL